jgi:hypothetical protein
MSAPAPPPHVLVAVNFRKPKHHLGELYTLITALLLSPSGEWGRWVLKDGTSLPFDLCIGESIARGIPFRLLGTNPSSRIRPPLVNFYQHFKQLTWKLDMVLTLKRWVCGRHRPRGRDCPRFRPVWLPLHLRLAVRVSGVCTNARMCPCICTRRRWSVWTDVGAPALAQVLRTRGCGLEHRHP